MTPEARGAFYHARQDIRNLVSTPALDRVQTLPTNAQGEVGAMFGQSGAFDQVRTQYPDLDEEATVSRKIRST